MKEISQIITAYEQAQREGHRTALATVVHVDGSAYRRPGARMLVTDEGVLTGAISGGCLEGDALRKAQLALSRQASMVVTYDTMEDDDAKLGLGLGCNGIIQVLFEPIDPDNPDNPIELLKQIAKERRPAVLVTLFSLAKKREPQPGTCILITPTTNDPANLRTAVKEHPQRIAAITDAQKALQEKQSSFKTYIGENEELTAFIEYIQPPISLIIIGAGNDVVPLAKMADILGWQTTIVDGRPSLAKQDRFTSSCQVVVAKPEKALENIAIDERTAFLLMTHNYNYDLALLKQLLNKNIKYIGSLGPKKKLDRMVNDLKEEEIEITEEQLNNIYGPSGLNIGAETPEEIALSILAEIKAVFADRPGTSLRNNKDVIHPRHTTEIEKVNFIRS